MTTFTREQLDIELLKQRNDSFAMALIRIESRMDSQFQHFESKMDSQFHLILGLVLGIYALAASTLIAKLMGVL